MTPEGLEHTTPRTPGASRLHGPQSNIAHALPSDMPRGRGTEDIDNADIHEGGPQGPGYEAATARVRALEAKRTDYPSHRQPVPRRLTGEDIAVTGEDTAEYGCRAEEYGIRGNHMPNPER